MNRNRKKYKKDNKKKKTKIKFNGELWQEISRIQQKQACCQKDGSKANPYENKSERIHANRTQFTSS